jgi:hypothetical protein
MVVRRNVVVLAAATAALVGLSVPAHAAGRPQSPQLTINGFSGPTPGYDPEAPWDWTLDVTAQDPDGVVVEVEVRWGDGSVSWAHTYCFLAPDPGVPHDMLIPHSYAAPGTYTVRARAVTLPTCDADWDDHEASRWVTTRVHAAPPPAA